MKLSISRYDPERDDKPYMQDFEIELVPTDHMLLDVHAAAEGAGQHPDLQKVLPRRRVRLRCDEHQRPQRPGLHHAACADLKEPVVLRPLPGFPIIRDLVVDMTSFFKQYHSITPYLVNDEPPPGKGAAAVAGRARQAERLVRVHPVRLLQQPVPFVLVEPGQVRRPGRTDPGIPFHRRQPRPRHRAAARRPRTIAYRLFRCRTIMNCAEVCPKGLEPVHAIERIRLKMAKIEGDEGPLDVHRPIAPR